jgi:hypothetical protein
MSQTAGGARSPTRRGNACRRQSPAAGSLICFFNRQDRKRVFAQAVSEQFDIDTGLQDQGLKLLLAPELGTFERSSLDIAVHLQLVAVAVEPQLQRVAQSASVQHGFGAQLNQQLVADRFALVRVKTQRRSSSRPAGSTS